MPLHDWSRVPSGLFHDFHQSGSIRIKDALNAGRLSKGFSALVEQHLLESTCQATWDLTPEVLQEAVLTGDRANAQHE